MTSRASNVRRVVIVGGGIAGLSIAVRLSQQGLPITLLEASQLGFGASTRNQGWLYSGAWFAPEHLQLARQCYHSLQQTIFFCPECVEPNQSGMLYLLAENDSQAEQWIDAWQAAGIPFQDLSPHDVLQAIPHWNPRQTAKAWRLPDRAIRTDILLSQLATTAEAQGVEVRTGIPVAGLLREEDRVFGVVAASGEELSADMVILATGGEATLQSEFFGERVGEQSSYQLVNLKTHLMAIQPRLCQHPFCVLDRGGFNHVPHSSSSIFGSNHWAIVAQSQDRTVEAVESQRITHQIAELLPTWEFSQSEAIEWAGTAVQAMHLEQIEPGRATLPTVIDHETEPGGLKNLLSVFPGRASLWPQLAEIVLQTVEAKRELTSPQVADPPWLAGDA